MPRSFTVDSPDRIVFGHGAEASVPAELGRLGAKRVLLVCQPGHRDGADRVAAALGSAAVGVFDQAKQHVPRDVADAAVAAARKADADWVLAHGGGTAVGVAKAISLDVDVKIAAVPTSYAGSERTDIWGITQGGHKTTGRDPRVRPALVVYDPALSTDLPRDFSLQSLLNALAHSIEALYADAPSPAATDAAHRSLGPIVNALRILSVNPTDASGRSDALLGAYLASESLFGGGVALHHKLAHVFGGTLGTPHALTHSILLPYTAGFNLGVAATAREALANALHTDDPAGGLYDLLREVGVPTSLRALDVPRERLDEVAGLATAKPYPNPRPFDRADLHSLLEDAWHDRRPSVRTRRIVDIGQGAHAGLGASERGASLSDAKMVILAVHGRGASSDRILASLEGILGRRPGLTMLAPQATDATWYPKPFTAPRSDNQPHLEDALSSLDQAWARATEHVDPERVVVVGFSQGACLALSWLTDRIAKHGAGHRPAGLVAWSGAHIDLDLDFSVLRDLPVYLSHSAQDPWLPAARLEDTKESLRRSGARARIHVEPGKDHRIYPADAQDLRDRVEATMTGDDLSYVAGFGNALASEARVGALPRRQNSPREVPYGLYAEQINGTGFAVERGLNHRVWVYRLRPQVHDRPWVAADPGRIVGRFVKGPAGPQIQRFKPTPLPTTPTDFVAGLTTFAGAGDPSLKAGMAIHLYGANENMTRRAFANIDGDLLVAPWDGSLRIRTELGVLHVRPGELAILPRGIRVSVDLPEGTSRGFVAELFAGHLVLPGRGPVGANGLADERHFKAPVAAFEDVEAEHELVVKQAGELWKSTTAFSPFDVVAWHGSYAPFKYDLRDFNTMGSVSFDHADPSILTVLTAPVDTHGRSALDVAAFLGRWDVAEHSFRPPFLHRNSAIEFNMVISAPEDGDGPWQPGTFSYTPYLAPHAVSAHDYRAATAGPDATADRPVRIPDRSIWLQFESTYLLRQTRWATEALDPDEDYLASFRGYPPATVPK